MTNPWFRLHSELLNDPKVQKLDGETFKVWINLLCVTNDSVSSTFQKDNCAFLLRMDEVAFVTAFETLHAAGLIVEEGDGYQPKGWAKRQYTSDNSTSRVQKYREKKKQKAARQDVSENVSSNVSSVVTETPPDSDSDSEADTEKEPPFSSPKGESTDLFEAEKKPEDKPKRKRAIQIPDGFPDDAAKQRAVEYFQNNQRSDIDPNQEAEKFRDFKLADGKAHKDWDAAWRTWCRNAITYSQKRQGQSNVSRGTSRHTDAETWAIRVENFYAKDLWNPDVWGPAPGQPGCGAPPEVLARFTEKRRQSA